jgi:glycerol uptake operon antiterminator
MKKRMLSSLKKYPIIGAIKNESGLKACLTSKSQVIFVLYGDICNIKRIIDTIKSANKIAIVHIDLIAGLSNSEIAVNYLAENTDLDGIISTKYNLIKAGNEKGLITVQRIFIIDSLAIKSLNNNLKQGRMDFIEILPGVMPKVIKKIVSGTKVPIIAGGLISDQEDIQNSLDAGAIGVSTTKEDLWIKSI